MARHSHEEARRSIASLRPESIESAALLPALRTCAERMVHQSGVIITTDGDSGGPAIPLRIKDTLFRIGQEAIANAVRHAKATTINIYVRYERSSVCLRISDNGAGFVPGTEQSGFGIIGMRRRADSISADSDIRSAPQTGTEVQIIAPLPAKLTLSTFATSLKQYITYAAKRTHPYPDRG